MTSSLKLGAYPRRERLKLLIKDRLFWKAIAYSFWAALSLASTPIAILLTAISQDNAEYFNLGFYIAPALFILALVIFFPLGVFAEFLYAESEHRTMAEFSVESIALDLKIIKRANVLALCIILPIVIARFILNKYRQATPILPTT
jgi:hypothetical protein